MKVERVSDNENEEGSSGTGLGLGRNNENLLDFQPIDKAVKVLKNLQTVHQLLGSEFERSSDVTVIREGVSGSEKEDHLAVWQKYAKLEADLRKLKDKWVKKCADFRRELKANVAKINELESTVQKERTILFSISQVETSSDDDSDNDGREPTRVMTRAKDGGTGTFSAASNTVFVRGIPQEPEGTGRSDNPLNALHEENSNRSEENVNEEANGMAVTVANAIAANHEEIFSPLVNIAPAVNVIIEGTSTGGQQQARKRRKVGVTKPRNVNVSTDGNNAPSTSNGRVGRERQYDLERPFPCKFCGKRFNIRGCLLDHIRTHTGEKPFACHLCGRSFAQNSNLTTHIRTVHGEQTFGRRRRFPKQRRSL